MNFTLRVLKKLGFYFAIIVLALFLLIWLASPYMIRPILNDQLMDYGMRASSFSTIRYNPFLTKVSIRDLSLIKGKDTPFSIQSLDVQLNLPKLLFKRVVIEELDIQGVTLEATKAASNINVAGFDVPTQDDTKQENTEKNITPDKQQPDYTIIIPNINLADILIKIQDEQHHHTLELTSLIATNIKASSNSQKAKVNINALINGAPVKLKSDINLAKGSGRINLESEISNFDLSQIEYLASQHLKQITGQLSFNQNLALNIDQQNIKVSIDKTKLTTSDLTVEYTPWIYHSKNQTLSANDTELELTAGEFKALSTKLKLNIINTSVALKSLENQLVGWQQLDIPSINVSVDEGFNATIPNINFTELELSKTLQQNLESTAKAALPQDDNSLTTANITSQSALTKISALTIVDTYLTDKGVAVSDINLSDLSTKIIIDENKNIVSLTDFSSLEAEPSKSDQSDSTIEEEEAIEETSNEKQDKAFNIALKRFQLLSPANIYFEDRSVTPAYVRTLSIEELATGPLDSTQPEIPTLFKLKGRSNEYAHYEFNGHAKPFREKMNAEIKGQLQEVSLPEVSTYFKEQLGFDLQSGQLNTDVDVTIADDLLGGNTEVFIRGLKMSKADSYEQSTINDGKAMPLNSALNMLKDKKGNIKLKVPVSGDISEPSFGMRNFIALVFKKAAMSKAKSYLMNTFVPYAGVVSVAITGAKFALKARFEPLNYRPGQSNIDDNQEEFVDKLAALLKDKKKLQLKTCALSTHSDIGLDNSAELNKNQIKQLIDLGKKREDELKRVLVDKGIDSSRILFCKPEIDAEKEAVAKIKFAIN